VDNIALAAELTIMRALNAGAHFTQWEIQIAKAKNTLEGRHG